MSVLIKIEWQVFRALCFCNSMSINRRNVGIDHQEDRAPAWGSIATVAQALSCRSISSFVDRSPIFRLVISLFIVF
jgi:hypothetical protein